MGRADTPHAERAVTRLMSNEGTTPGATPTTMAAVVGRRYGPPEVLSVERIPIPEPKDGEVLVQVAAASLNALDWHYLTGTPYFLRLMAGVRRPNRIIPGADVAGTVAATGGGVAELEVGDAVFGESAGGACAAYVTVRADRLVRKPPEVSFEAAAATPVAGLTALQGLRTHAALQPGERVLVNGAAGGVGTFAVQLAKALGAEVTAVCSTRNVDMVRALGADEVIDYTRDDVVRSGARFDVMFDNVGDRTPAELMSLLRPGARYVVITGPKTNRWLGPVPHLAKARWAFRRADASFHQFTESMNRDDLAYLGELPATGEITPAVDRVIGLDGVAAGLAELGTGHTRAKIVVLPT
jgi:NADPH:quinone reductase-like Zn-dependent oxidoreductase